MRRTLSIAVILTAGVSCGIAEAQQAPDAQIERRVPREVPEERPAPPSPARPRAMEPEPSAAPAEFIVAAAIIEGNKIFSKEELAPLYEDLLARKVSIDDLQAVAARITKYYQDAGYFLSQAFLPAQDLSAGIVTFKIAEGYAERVEFTGDAPVDGLVRRLGEALETFRPLRRADLERVLMLIGDSFGRIVEDAEVEEIDPTAGRYGLRIALRSKPDSVSVVYDNRGTESAGRGQLWVSAATNRLVDPDTQVRVGVFTVPSQPQELKYGEAEISRLAGSYGTVLSLYGARSESDAGGLDAVDDIEGRSERLQLRLAHPLLRSRKLSLWFNGAADWRNVEENGAGARNYKDQIRALRGGFYLYAEDPLGGGNRLWTELAVGTDALGGSKQGDLRSRFGADAEFSKVQASHTRYQPITENLGVQTLVAGQYADGELLSAEEFSLGGSSIGRAYEFSELSGDHGLGGSVELQYGDSWDEGFPARYQVYGFYDFGMVWNDGEFEADRESLASAGFGVRVGLTKSLNVELEYAEALTRPVNPEGDKVQRIFLQLRYQY